MSGIKARIKRYDNKAKNVLTLNLLGCKFLTHDKFGFFSFGIFSFGVAIFMMIK